MSLETVAGHLAERFLLKHLPVPFRGALSHLHSVALRMVNIVPAGPHRDAALDHLEKAAAEVVAAIRDKKETDKEDQQ